MEADKPDMPYQLRHHYRLHTGQAFSAFSLTAAAADASYEIHLVKAGQEDYIPADMEVWPLYHSAILLALRMFPDAHQAAIDAVKKLQQTIVGRRNRDLPFK
jgi:hypothetical protein